MEIENIRIKKILYATDLSETATHAFHYAASLAGKYRAGITILHVLTEFPGEQFVTHMISTDTWKQIKSRHYSEARDKLIGKKRDYAAIREVLHAFSEEAQNAAAAQLFETDEVLIEAGNPADVIVETAAEGRFDMIVMGTHGHGGITDMLMGSTAKRVIRQSAVPVLVVRLPE